MTIPSFARWLESASSRGWAHAALLAVFSLGTLLTVGYGFGLEDSANYAPLAWEQIRPGTFAGDRVFQLIHDSSWNHHTSFFTTLTATLGRLLSLEGAYFALHFLSLWGLFGAIWWLGRAIGGTATGYLALLALVASRQVGGTRFATLPNELVPRSLSSALAFVAVALVVSRRHRLAAALASVATLLHPISALMALPVVALAPLLDEGPWRKRLQTLGVGVAIIVLPYLLWHGLVSPGPTAEVGVFSTVSQAWQQLIDFRLKGQAVNVGGWHVGEWLAIGVPLLLWMLALGERQPLSGADRTLFVAVAAATTLAAIGSAGADVFRSGLLTQMMLSRLMYLPLVVGTIYGAWWLAGRWQAGGWLQRAWVLLAFACLAQGGMAPLLLALIPIALLTWSRPDPWSHLAAKVLAGFWLAAGTAIALAQALPPFAPAAAPPHWLAFGEPPLVNVWLLAGLAGLLLAAGRRRGARAGGALIVALAPVLVFTATHRHLVPAGVAPALAARVQAPWQPANTAWREVTAWAREATAPGSRFLVPLHQSGFRAMAQRPIVTDWKDGGLTLYSQQRGEQWMALYQALSGYEKLPAPALAALARAHGCAYVIMPAERPLAWPRVFVTGAYAVYAVPVGS